MANPKIIDLIKVLAYNTSEGKIAWKKSTEEGVFNATLKDYSVQVSTSLGWDEMAEAEYTAYLVRLFDSDGELIAEFTPSNFERGDLDDRYPYSTFEDLYGNARSIAMGIDKAVDAILSQLPPLPPPPHLQLSPTPDDDIPF